MNVVKRDWYGLYGESWQGEIVPDAFAHPAKFSRALIRQIYRHCIEQGYIRPGDTVVDPFGGVGLGGLDAMRNGLHWRGIELEEKFVGLGNQNIALWNGRYAAHFRGWGTAVLVQGDSRQLADILSEQARTAVSSPPFLEGRTSNRAQSGVIKDQKVGAAFEHRKESYGQTSGQLAGLPEGNLDAAVGSPPFVGVVLHDGGPVQQQGGKLHSDYGRADGQLGSMPEGQLDGTISSPPYADAVSGNGDGPGARHDPVYHNGANAHKNSSQAEYGSTPGNLGNMAASIGSPPFEGVTQGTGGSFKELAQAWNANPENQNKPGYRPNLAAGYERQSFADSYGNHPDNIGNDAGETFWTAARTIVEQVHMTLKPGGYSVWVCKNFVRNKQIVEFSNQWQALCEACGFVPVERIRAWVIEERGTQGNLFTGEFETRTIERKSFFRRLAEKKGSPRIDWEDVIILRKEVVKA